MKSIVFKELLHTLHGFSPASKVLTLFSVLLYPPLKNLSTVLVSFGEGTNVDVFSIRHFNLEITTIYLKCLDHQIRYAANVSYCYCGEEGGKAVSI
jgi:hypothetical protein